MSIEEITQKSPLTVALATSAWQKEKTSHIEMDTVLCEEFIKILYEEIKKPNLGNATTLELIEELDARIQLAHATRLKKELSSEQLAYKTTDY